MKAPSSRIVLLGCGNMGGAVLKAWLEVLSPSYTFTLITPHKDKIVPFLSFPSVRWVEAGKPLDEDPDLIVIATKPQVIEEALKSYAHFKNCVYMSMAAGKQVKFYKPLLIGQPFIRIMPNLPSAVKEGITAAYTLSSLSPQQKQLIHSMLEALGQVIWLKDEDHFHPITAISGSGPAYVFLLTEILTKIAIKHGLSSPIAEKLGYQIVLGSGLYMKQMEKKAGALREQVTSPAGTTAAALKILMNPLAENLETLLDKAIQAAVQRSHELE